MSNDKTQTITVRAPADLITVLAEWARLEDRSLNAQIVRLLREATEEREGK